VPNLTTSYLFAGEQWDDDFGMHFLRARYLTQDGRFTTQDTFEGNEQTVDSLHKYFYAGQNPVHNIDYSGNFYTVASLQAATIGFASFSKVVIGRALVGALVGGALGGLDGAAAKDGDFFESAKHGALTGAVLGPLTIWSKILPALRVAGTLASGLGAYQSFSDGEIQQGAFRSVLAFISIAPALPKLYFGLTGRRSISVDRLVPNPADEFFNLRVGPSETQLRYHAEIVRNTGQIEGRIFVKDLGNGMFGILNGHHRWFVAQRFGISQVPIEVVR
jgi:RHS repeat-associated protein